jgi:hypothetical protein
MQPQLTIEPDFYLDHDVLFASLRQSIHWDDRMTARRTASVGKPYNYSQIDYPETPMLPELIGLQTQLQARLGIQFNNCLLNYY